jgi:hypothetical protein
MITAYNTGKVRIGIAHQRPAMPIYGDALIIQQAYLSKNKPRRGLLNAMANAIWRWL